MEYNMVDPETDRLSPMKLRTRLGMTQVQLAAALGKHPSTIGKWESGRVVPVGTPQDIARLCSVYQCSLDELVEAFPAIDSTKKESVEITLLSGEPEGSSSGF